jgi:hypothetical protein
MNEQDVIRSAASLRGQRKYQEAIDIVESNVASLEAWARCPAMLQAFYAAIEAGMTEKARELARSIAKQEPLLPSIQKYLG